MKSDECIAYFNVNMKMTPKSWGGGALNRAMAQSPSLREYVSSKKLINIFEHLNSIYNLLICSNNNNK